MVFYRSRRRENADALVRQTYISLIDWTLLSSTSSTSSEPYTIHQWWVFAKVPARCKDFGSNRVSHIMIMWDFNFPDNDSESKQAIIKYAATSKFFEKTQYLFLVQPCMQPRGSGKDRKPSTFDYVFTDEEYLFQHIISVHHCEKVVMRCLSGTGKCCWKICEMDSKLLNRNFWKRDYNQIQKGLL